MRSGRATAPACRPLFSPALPVFQEFTKGASSQKLVAPRPLAQTMLCRLVVVLALSGADALNLGAAASRRSFIAKVTLRAARTTELWLLVGIAPGFAAVTCCIPHTASFAAPSQPCSHVTGRRCRRLARRRRARLRRGAGPQPDRQGRDGRCANPSPSPSPNPGPSPSPNHPDHPDHPKPQPQLQP